MNLINAKANLINAKASVSDKLWEVGVANQTSRNELTVYAETIQEALTLADNFADKNIGGSWVESIERAN